MELDFVIVGGGFFGCRLALALQKLTGGKVLLLEKGADLMLRASYNNQARVHNGYHYPRSLITALRSRVNFPKFVKEYPDCVSNSFDKYYAVAGLYSKVNADQFKTFFERIEAPITKAPDKIKKLFNKNLIQEAFSVKEYAFDSSLLREEIWKQLRQAKIEVKTEACAASISSSGINKLKVLVHQGEQEEAYYAKKVFNCTYSNINSILNASGLEKLHLKQELTEMALVQVPDQVKNIGVTIMCGPFFSIMPFPAKKLHTLSHVRYTPHASWYDRENKIVNNDDFLQQPLPTSRYIHMLKDAVRYMPSLKECSYVDSLWEIKTVLPSSEGDDSRPILIKQNEVLQNLYTIMGGKIDNVYDMEDQINDLALNCNE